MATIHSYRMRWTDEDVSFDAYCTFSDWVNGRYRDHLILEPVVRVDEDYPRSHIPIDTPSEESIEGFRPCHDEPYWTVLDLIQAWIEMGHGAEHLYSYTMHLRFIAMACAEWNNPGTDPSDPAEGRALHWTMADEPDRSVPTYPELHGVVVKRAMLPHGHRSDFGGTRHPVFDERWFLEWKMQTPQVLGKNPGRE